MLSLIAVPENSISGLVTKPTGLTLNSNIEHKEGRYGGAEFQLTNLIMRTQGLLTMPEMKVSSVTAVDILERMSVNVVVDDQINIYIFRLFSFDSEPGI